MRFQSLHGALMQVVIIGRGRQFCSKPYQGSSDDNNFFVWFKPAFSSVILL